MFIFCLTVQIILTLMIALMEQLSVDDVIAAAGGTRRIADELGVKTGAVRQWRWQGYVPGLRVLDVAELAGIDPRQVPRKPSVAA